MSTPSRRQVLRGLAVGAALIASGTAIAGAPGGPRRFEYADGEAPWWLLKPLQPEAPLGGGWRVAALSAVRKGAAVLTLSHADGGTVDIHLCARGGRTRGVASTWLVDLVVMDGGDGAKPTDERLGRIVKDLASRIRMNEVASHADLRPLTRMLPHAVRLETYGPKDL